MNNPVIPLISGNPEAYTSAASPLLTLLSPVFCSPKHCQVSPLTGEILFLVLPRKSTQKEVAPVMSLGCAECSALHERNGGAAELGPAALRQSSPFSPLRPALLDDTKGKRKTESRRKRSVFPPATCFILPSFRRKPESRNVLSGVTRRLF
jgi:hypothetical protein